MAPIIGSAQHWGNAKAFDNKTVDLPTTILLNAFALSRSAIAGRMPAKCKALPGYIPFEGR